MAGEVHIPTAQEIREMLLSLLDRDVAVGLGMAPGTGTRVLSIEYADESGRVRASIVCDLPAAAAMGGALTMVPPETVEEAARTGTFGEALLENYNEVCNIMSTLFAGPHDLSLVVKRPVKKVTYIGPSPHKLEDRSKLSVQVPGYGGGVMVIRT